MSASIQSHAQLIRIKKNFEFESAALLPIWLACECVERVFLVYDNFAYVCELARSMLVIVLDYGCALLATAHEI